MGEITPRLSNKPNASGAWEITWSDRGRTKRVSTRTSSRAAANRFLAAFIIESENVKPEQAECMTIGALLDFYQETHAAERVADPERTANAAKPLRAFFADRRPADVDDVLLVRYAEKRRAGGLGRAVKDGTVRRELEHLRAVLNYAVRNKKRTGVHADDIPHIDMPAKAEPRNYVMTEAELDRLMHQVAPKSGAAPCRAYVFIALARYTAARKEAIETLTWDRVNLERGQIDYREPGRRKTSKRRVPVPIDGDLLPVLRAAKIAAKPGDTFVVAGGGAIRKAFRSAADDAGLPRCTPHVLRHTWATHAIERGVPLQKVALMLGDTLESVTKNYVHLSADYLDGAVPDRGKTPESGTINA